MGRRLFLNPFISLTAALWLACATTNAEVYTLENIDIKFGARIHALASATDDDSVSDRDHLDLQIRRARLRLSAIADEWITLFIQTDVVKQDDTIGSGVVLIDANVSFKPRAETQLIIGQHMAPALRQNVSSSGALLTIDRPAINFKSLNWGTRALAGFSRITQTETDSGVRGEVDVRDTGATFFGVKEVADQVHLKYYAGIYEGARSAASDHLSTRAQLNWGDAEQGYFNSANYLGKKQTVALGLSIDQQSEVATDLNTNSSVDYLLYSADLFIAKGPLTFEAAYINLDLGGAGLLAFEDATPLGSNKAQGVEAEGDGFYIQGAWQLGKWQPWFAYETWSSNADNKAGSFSATRFGTSYHLNKFSSFKAGIEQWSHEQVADGEDDEFVTLTAGYFITF